MVYLHPSIKNTRLVGRDSMMERTGPHPLWLHLNGGAAMMAAASEDKLMFKASSQMFQEALSGVKSYHDSDIEPFHREMDIVFEINKTRVLKPKAWKGEAYVLLVPSLINSWHIFDIEQDHSLMACLYDNGLVPLVIEWADPQDSFSFETYITEHLKPICDALDIESIIGYCMGGTMIAALYCLYPDLKIDKAILIAPPWDFDYQTPDQRMRIQSLAMQTHMMGHKVPRDYIQSLFWAVDPLQVFKKFQKFPKIANPQRFVRVEDWLNEGQEVSRSVIQTCLFDWYRDNAITKGEWVVDNAVIDDQSLPKKTIIVAGEKDHLVPFESLEQLTLNRDVVTVDTGHIGLMASDKSVTKAWQPIVNFLLD